MAAGTAYSSRTAQTPAPYFRRECILEELPERAELLVCGVGFYELYINGRRITRSALAPYISNPDDCLYYDAYDVTEFLQAGANCVGLWLGNGLRNNPYGWVWEFDRARFRGAPCAALSLDLQVRGEHVRFDTSEGFKSAPSPLLFDDYRSGERYDARLELPGWAEPGFDDSAWVPVVAVESPRGEATLNSANPIVVEEEVVPREVVKLDDGYLYDFGINSAGVCRLRIQGDRGQRIILHHGEHLLEDGSLDLLNLTVPAINGADADRMQRDEYICKGGEMETYVPRFTYHGFRYVWIRGICEEQAGPDTLTFLVMHTKLRERGGFRCSDETVNTLQRLTRRSTLANFFHFPTDCPQREKNGWTADAALSAEHTLLNLEPENNYRQWLQGIRKAMNDAGALPGIVPTSGYGYDWGNGPAWDCVLVYLPYYTWLYRGDTAILEENAHAILRYLEYLSTRVNADGLIAIGLGDWCPPGRDCGQYKAPLVLTDTLISMDICRKAARLFEVLERPLSVGFAQAFYKALRRAARLRLLDTATKEALGSCQTSQAMALYYQLFEPGEETAAFSRLLAFIERDGRVMDTGVLGGRVLFHVLAQFGRADLAFELITTERFPSYGNWVARGAVSLWEEFQPEGGTVSSLNHHFWGDISHWFIRWLAGIHYNPLAAGGCVDIRPQFIPSLQFAEGFHEAPEGRIEVKWKRNGDAIKMNLTLPATLRGVCILPDDYVFEDGLHSKPAQSGVYAIRRGAAR